MPLAALATRGVFQFVRSERHGEHLIDFGPVHVHNLEAESSDIDVIPHSGNSLESPQDHACNRMEIAFFQDLA